MLITVHLGGKIIDSDMIFKIRFGKVRFKTVVLDVSKGFEQNSSLFLIVVFLMNKKACIPLPLLLKGIYRHDKDIEISQSKAEFTKLSYKKTL